MKRIDMNKNKVEEGITNLGLVPDGMSFSEAIDYIKPEKKYFIDPFSGGHRLTICDTLRMTWREAAKLPPSKEKDEIIKYLEQAFDFGKRMDARMKYLRSVLEEHNIDYTKGK